MKVQEAIGNFCNKVQQTAGSAAEKVSSAFYSTVHKVVNFFNEVVKPRVNDIKDYLKANKQLVLVTVGAGAAGALLYAIVQRVCCTKEPNNSKFQAGFVKA